MVGKKINVIIIIFFLHLREFYFVSVRLLYYHVINSLSFSHSSKSHLEAPVFFSAACRKLVAVRQKRFRALQSGYNDDSRRFFFFVFETAKAFQISEKCESFWCFGDDHLGEC